MSEKIQYFNGIHFTRDDNSGYYGNSTLHISMHRYVWEYYNGPVPKNCEIHHIDQDKSNNTISNLQCLTKSEHRKVHAYLLSDKDREWRRNNINENARPKAIEWHKSEEGLKWHKQQILSRKDPRHNVINICMQCGKEFTTYGLKTNKFCSGACQQQYRRDNGLNLVDAVCEVCGKSFKTDKYKKAITCSSSCRVKWSWQHNRNTMGKKSNNENKKNNKKTVF